ncbi:MAG TPA: LLM class flavin-dependent oxidoreductase [Actinomycetota bacterium]|nr:LLM class flavin-dependent oxidoreductase [Actinomycetota bacterium]
MTVAISLPPPGLALSEVPAYAREAESLGYDSCWIAEVAGNDAFALGSAVAAVTSRLRLGTAVVPVNTRGPAMLSMAAATMDGVSGGRGICGIGVSSPAIVSDWNGQPSGSPLRRARETIEVLRLALTGQKVDYEGSCVRVRGFRIVPPPPRSVPIYLGALNPGMLKLAGELADGVVLNMVGEDFVPAALEHVRAGALSVGRDPDSIEVVIRLQTCVGEDEDAARDGFARAFAAYVIARGYAEFFTWQGFGDCVRGVREAFAARDRQAAREAISDRMLDALVVSGDRDRVRSRIDSYMAAGVTTPAVHAFWPTRDAALRTMRACAPA